MPARVSPPQLRPTRRYVRISFLPKRPESSRDTEIPMLVCFQVNVGTENDDTLFADLEFLLNLLGWLIPPGGTPPLLARAAALLI